MRIYDTTLPHWRQAGATYFVTFRLADSIPRHPPLPSFPIPSFPSCTWERTLLSRQLHCPSGVTHLSAAAASRPGPSAAGSPARCGSLLPVLPWRREGSATAEDGRSQVQLGNEGNEDSVSANALAVLTPPCSGGTRNNVAQRRRIVGHNCFETAVRRHDNGLRHGCGRDSDQVLLRVVFRRNFRVEPELLCRDQVYGNFYRHSLLLSFCVSVMILPIFPQKYEFRNRRLEIVVQSPVGQRLGTTCDT